MQEKADIVLGYAATSIGTTGAALQLFGQIGSVLVLGLNVILALGGIYLLRLRIKQAHYDRKRTERAFERYERDTEDKPPTS